MYTLTMYTLTCIYYTMCIVHSTMRKLHHVYLPPYVCPSVFVYTVDYNSVSDAMDIPAAYVCSTYSYFFYVLFGVKARRPSEHDRENCA